MGLWDGMDAPMSDAARQAADRYEAAMHGMQTGVALDIQRGEEEGPKHLRVGVNSALLNSSALGALLIRKGLITEDEYIEILAEFAEYERSMYEQRLGVRLG